MDPVRNFNLIILRASRSDDDDQDRSKVGEATLLRVRSSSDVPGLPGPERQDQSIMRSPLSG